MAGDGFGAFTSRVDPATRRALDELWRKVSAAGGGSVDLSAIEADILALQGDIVLLDADLTAAEADIAALELAAAKAADWMKVEWNQTTATAGSWIGSVGAGAGTFAVVVPGTSGTKYQTIKRSRYSNVVTTLNQVLGQRNTESMFYRGPAAGQGGYLFRARFGFDTWTNGGRLFAGLHSATTVVTGNPSSLNNTIGFCVDAADNGAISFLTRNTTTATKAATGLTITSAAGYDVEFYCAPAASSQTWRITDINTGTSVTGTATLTQPGATTLLTAGVLASNAALTTANAIQLGVNRISVQVP